MAKRNADKRDAERELRKRKLKAQGARLKRWFDQREERVPAHMARALGVSDFAVHAWCHGERSASQAFAEAIEIYTDGAVKAGGWPGRDLRNPRLNVVAFRESKRDGT